MPPYFIVTDMADMMMIDGHQELLVARSSNNILSIKESIFSSHLTYMVLFRLEGMYSSE